MPRELRPRKARQSYANLSVSKDEEEREPGPSQQRSIGQGEDDNGSDFAPPGHEGAAGDSSDEGIPDPASPVDVAGAGIDFGPEGDLTTRPSKTASRGKAKNKARAEAKAKGKQKAKAAAPTNLQSPAPSATAVPVPPGPATAMPGRHNYALPNPNIHHRHRPVPLFPGPTITATASSGSASEETVHVPVERLLRPPLLFAPNETTPTNAYAANAALTRRVGKAWVASVGAGPVWQIVEDLGWFREAKDNNSKRGGGGGGGGGAAREEQITVRVGGEAQAAVSVSALSQTEAQVQGSIYDEPARRPKVYVDLGLPEGWAVPIRAECVSLLLSPHQMSRASAF